MLDLGRYLLGVGEIAVLLGLSLLAAASVRSHLLPSFSGAPAHLATAVIALALLIWAAELLGSFGAWGPVPYLVLMALIAVLCRLISGGWHQPRGRERKPRPQASRLVTGPGGAHGPSAVTLIALTIAALAVLKFALELKPHLSTGMTGFDSTWYHGPFAAGFSQSGDTWSLHFIAPQFLAWFYPANGEIFHGVGMLAFGRDILSPLLNLGWFVGCLVACWCIGRPYRVAPWSLALGAIALSVPALADQAGEARNDIVGIFFLLAAVAIALSAWQGRAGNGVAGEDEKNRLGGGGEEDGLGVDREEDGLGGEEGSGDAGLGPWLVVGLAAGLAAGTKLNFLLPAGVLVVGLTLIASRGQRWRALAAGGLGALAGGGYWYLRNLAHSGNPLPWIDSFGPIPLPAPDQALGGREAHSVLGYLTDGTVWSDWFLPGLRDGLWFLWPLLLAAALAGLVLCLPPRRRAENPRGSWETGPSTDRVSLAPGRADRVLQVVGAVGLAAGAAWLVAPTSASGPDGMPRGFESGLRYLAPALVLGLALLPTTPLLRSRLAGIAKVRSSFGSHSATKDDRTSRRVGLGPVVVAGLGLAVFVVIAVGYPVQRHYLENRYADPSFTTPGLNAAFAWARDIHDSRIATTSTRQYPLFGTDLSNQVEFIGRETSHGGFVALTTCRAWREALNEGDYDYVVASRDRIEPGKPPYPPQARWTKGPGAKPVLRTPPTVVFKLNGKLDPAACP